jgi:hypothetical protein
MPKAVGDAERGPSRWKVMSGGLVAVVPTIVRIAALRSQSRLNLL